MRFLIGVPVLVLLVLFALSNKQVVTMGLWPTDITVDAPLSVAVLVASAVFFVAGALMTWGASLAARTRTLQARPVPEPRAAAAPQPDAPAALPNRAMATLSAPRA